MVPGTNFNLKKALDSFYGIKGGELSFGPFPERGQDGKAKRETLSSFLQRGIEDDMELAGGYMDYMPMNDTNQLISGSFNMPINPDAFNQDRKLRKIYEKGKSTTNPYEKEIFLKKAGPQLFPKVQGFPVTILVQRHILSTVVANKSIRSLSRTLNTTW